MSKKLGSKLAESVRQQRSNRPGQTAGSDATPADSTSLSPAARNVAAGTGQSVRTTSGDPAASHDVLHPSRIWPD